MINVLSLVPYQFLPPKMGGQKCIALGNKYLAKYLNLTCITTENNINNEDVNYAVFNILSNSKLRYINVFYFFTIRNIVKKNRISHLIIEHPYYGWLAILLKFFCGIKLIVRSHNIESNRFKTIGKWWWKLLWHYEKTVHKNADLSLFITNEDLSFAQKNFNLHKKKCEVITYGFELKEIPSEDLRKSAKLEIRNQHKITENETIILFNGTLDYKPNLDAIDSILNFINPILLKDTNFKYKIIICGKNLPSSYNNTNHTNIILTGFVNDIGKYYLGSDIFINPVIDGGGIKTKIVEALGYNLSLITTKSGSIGIPNDIIGNKMTVVNDTDWITFADCIKKIDTSINTPTSYFEHFYWGNIAEKAASNIKSI
ncbi:MAG: glycosyltransferase [Chitinophagaceae bacterium]